MSVADDTAARYPLCTTALTGLLSTSTAPATAMPVMFRLGPGVLRPPPPVARRTETQTPARGDDDDGSNDGDVDTGDLLGELVDMMLVGANDADSGHPEVHLQFKSSVFGGLHLRLVKTPAGLVATFGVADAATKRAVAGHVDDLVTRLRGRGFAVVEARLEVS